MHFNAENDFIRDLRSYMSGFDRDRITSGGQVSGLGAIGGMAETYWGKNKRTFHEGTLEKFTTFAAVAFMVLGNRIKFSLSVR